LSIFSIIIINGGDDGVRDGGIRDGGGRDDQIEYL
jgi:hypothetical protein